jgi:nicotinamide mononucleotide transporter
MSVLEAVAVVFGFAYVVFVIRQSVWCWPAGLASASLYVLVFFHVRLYGQVALQGVYIVLMVYGWYEWLHGGEGGGRLRVSRTPLRWRGVLAVVGVALTLAFGLLLKKETDAVLPFWDAGTVSFSLVAQLMTTRKWIESWLVWIGVNVVYVGLYVSQRLYPTSALFGAFLVLAVVGLIQWRRSLYEDRSGEAASSDAASPA